MLINFSIRFFPEVGDISVPVSWVSVVLAFVVSCSTGLIFGYFPANRAAKLTPLNRCVMNKTRHLLCLALAVVALGVLPAQTHAQTSGKFTLREAVTLALQNSPELKLARVQYTVALNEAGVDRATFRPNLYTGSGAAYTYGFPSLPGGNAPAVFQLAYTQSIFDPLAKGEQRAAEERAKNQKLEIDRLHDDVIVRAASSYLELADVKHSLDLMRNEEASAEKILQVTQDRVNANQELPIEVTRSELTLARTRERIVKLENRVAALSQRIRNLTGIPDDQPVDVDTEEPSFTIDQQETEIANLAVQNDPGVQEAEMSASPATAF